MVDKPQIGVIKLGGRITKAKMGAVAGEAISIIDMLAEDFDVIAYTKRLKRDEKFEYSCFIVDIEEYHKTINDLNLKALVVINGNVNFFGGAEDRTQMLNYHIINNFKGPVFYILCDPSLTLKQIWPSVQKKAWGSKYKEDDILIKRTDIVCLSQPYALDCVKDLIVKAKVHMAEVIHFPFEKFPMIYKNEIARQQRSIATVDLMYGGTIRSGRREDKLIKYYFGYPEEISVELFGPIKLKQFKEEKFKHLRAPEFSGNIDFDEMSAKMGTSLVTVCISDEWSDGRNFTQRIYENLMSSAVCLIDEWFDPEHLIFGHPFFYVKTRHDVLRRISAIKDSALVHNKVMDRQNKIVKEFSITKYKQDFCRIITERIK